MATLTDPLSGLVDEWLGRVKIPYSPHKTLEGSLSFFCLGVVALYLLGASLRVSLLVSLGVTFLESLCVRGADNFAVPLSTGLFLKYFGW
jgi:dolichol kinase